MSEITLTIDLTAENLMRLYSRNCTLELIHMLSHEDWDEIIHFRHCGPWINRCIPKYHISEQRKSSRILRNRHATEDQKRTAKALLDGAACEVEFIRQMVAVDAFFTHRPQYDLDAEKMALRANN